LRAFLLDVVVEVGLAWRGVPPLACGACSFG
jgi:hypothetical protein